MALASTLARMPFDFSTFPYLLGVVVVVGAERILLASGQLLSWGKECSNSLYFSWGRNNWQ